MNDSLPPSLRAGGSMLLSLLLLCTSANRIDALEIDPSFSSPDLAEPAPPQRVLVLPDDSFLAYWNFNRWNAQNAGLVVKFQPDGTRDPAFRFDGPYFHVTAVTPAPDGKFIVAARRHRKTSVRHEILRLNGDGSVDESFSAGSGADRDVYALAVDADGKVLVGGVFRSFNGEARQGILRLEATGGIDPTFSAVAFLPDQTNQPVGIRSKIVVQPDGKILFGGTFGGVNESPRDGVARLNADGSVDPSFVPAAVRSGSGTGGQQPVAAVELQPDGKILAASRFVTPGSGIISPLVRMSAEGNAELYFPGRPNQTGPGITRPTGRSLKLLSNGDTVVVGDRIYLYSAEGAERPGSQSVTVPGFYVGADTMSDGRILVAGGEVSRSDVGIERFSPSAVRDNGFEAGEFQREVLADDVAPRNDGEIWISSWLLRRVNGVERFGVARLDRDGTLDPVKPAFRTYASGISMQPDQRVVIFGASVYDRFNLDDTEDEGFANDTTVIPFSGLSPARDGKHFVLVDQPYTVLDDSVILQLRADGFTNQEFELGVKFSEVATSDEGRRIYFGDNRPMVNYPDGRFLLRYFDNTGTYRLGRFHENGAVDPTFQTSSIPALVKTEFTQTLSDRFGRTAPRDITFAGPTVLTDVHLLPDGRALVTGMFREFNGVPARGIVRLQENGALDPGFDAGSGAEWTSTVGSETQLPRVDAVEQLSDGKLLITGDFEAFDGVAAPGIARLHSDGRVDGSFAPPVARQLDTTVSEYNPWAFSPMSNLYREAGGTFILSGNYAPGGGPIRTLMRLRDTAAKAAPLNISTRLNVQTGENVMIGGFIITGSAPKKVIVRALGTSLGGAGVTGTLADPMLELIAKGSVLASNDNWKDSQQPEIQGSGVPPENELESAIVRTLEPGAYTAVVRGNNGGTGVGLVELYDLDQGAASHLANISTRGFVQTEENVMIGGFILGGGGEANILVRALGPSLGDDGVAGALQDPMLELRDNSGNLVAENDNWKSTQQGAIEATTIPPKRDAEAAVLASLQPGAYTAIVRGKNATTGVALVEVYNVQ